MITRALRINGSTRTGRIEMASRAGAAIRESGGWVIDFRQFSNVSVCINFEIPAKNVEKLHQALKEIDLRLTEESEEALANHSRLQNHPSAKLEGPDISGTLQITFIHNEPDLRRDVPAIPG